MAFDLIGFISPAWAYRRELDRVRGEELRNYREIRAQGYDAASYDRLNMNWWAANQSAEDTDRGDRDTLCARARDMERNSDIFNSVILAFIRNAVGNGFTLQANTGKKDLDDQLEALWKEWCKPRNCDVTGTQSFNQILRMAVRRKKVDGGMLLVKCYTDGGLLPFKLQALEVDELAVSQTKPHAKGNKVVGGVEYNRWNRAMGYWIQQYQLDGMTLVDPVFYPENDVIFYFSKQRPSQVREVSDMKHVLTRIRDANEFMTAVSLKERIAACLSVFIRKLIPQGGGNMLGRSGEMTDGKPRPSYEGKTITPGMIHELGMGEDITVVNPGNSGIDAANHLKTQQRIIGAGTGLSYEGTSRDMSETNYSSARQGGIEDELTYAEEIELLTDVLTEIYETFVISAVLAGKAGIPNFWENKQANLRHSWVASPKKWIDPLKEARANEVALNSGLKTYPQIAAEQGRDWKDMLNEMKEVADYAASIGITIGGIGLAEQTKRTRGHSAPARLRHAAAGRGG